LIPWHSFSGASASAGSPFKIASAYQALLFKQAKEDIAAARLSIEGRACRLIIAVLFLEGAVLANTGFKEWVMVFP
jgi:hypothetical protein